MQVIQGGGLAIDRCFVARARVVGPVAGAGIAAFGIGTWPAGLYEIEVSLHYDGAVAAAEINNIQLRRGVTNIAQMEIAAVANVQFKQPRFYFEHDGSAGDFNTIAIGAGTAGVGYTAIVSIRRIRGR